MDEGFSYGFIAFCFGKGENVVYGNICHFGAQKNLHEKKTRFSLTSGVFVPGLSPAPPPLSEMWTFRTEKYAVWSAFVTTE
jgi:hypothetical protein